MSKKKLKNAPLREVIFELYWRLPLNSQGISHDPGFEFAQGVFESKIKNEFPIHKRLIPEGVPLNLLHKPLHQFWKGELNWPVIQFGQGILTVNDTDKNYEWENNFRDLVLNSIDTLNWSYKEVLPLNKVKLQYIDSVIYDPGREVIVDFISRNMNTLLENKFKIPGRQVGVKIVQSFVLQDDSLLNISIQNATEGPNGIPSIIWTYSVERKFSEEMIEIEKWLDYAHNICSNLFVDMLNPDFYASFDT